MSKKNHAVNYINYIRDLPADKLADIILDTAGEELSAFMLAYASRVLGDGSSRGVENASSLMLMGYLIAKAEKDQATRPTPTGLN